MFRWRHESVLDLYVIALAAFLFGTPWLFSYTNENARLDVWASSGLIIAIALATFIAFFTWEEWLNVLLGIWLIVSPWVLGFTHTRAMHYSIGIGIAVILLATLEIVLLDDKEPKSSAPSPPVA
ncbi:MAG TPA: SPW repeat protein [Xanthobacteraceae bacterium]|nr:SPW repeat protein [Xanthobacteraceae bacterium]